MPKGVPKKGFRVTKNRLIGESLKMSLDRVPMRSNETVVQIEQKLAERFEALEALTEATGRGTNRALIVSGPPGLGKSYTVEEKMAEFEKMGKNVAYIKGYVRPLALYKLLYETRHLDSILVFDDSDSIFADENCMNLLKTACDSTDRRVLHWLSKSIEREEDEEGESIPEKFDYEGSIIFITNKDFDALIAEGNKMSTHFEALVSRALYLDLAMKTKMDYIVRIKQVVRGGMMRKRGFTAAEEAQIMEFVTSNVEKFRELSLRMVVKLGNLYRSDKRSWQKFARLSCFRNG